MTTPRLKERYLKTVVPALKKEFGYKNPMEVPKLLKVAVNIGMGEATQNPKLMDGAVNELAAITGQRRSITSAKKSIAAVKQREDCQRCKARQGEESRQSEQDGHAEICLPGEESLLPLRPAARIHPQIPSVPDLFPAASPVRRDTRRDQGELVVGRTRREA